MLLRNQVNQLTKCCSICATFFIFHGIFVASVLHLLYVRYTAQNSILFHIMCNILHNINRHSVSYHTAFIHFAELSSFTCMIWFTFNDFHAPAISYHESKAIIHLVDQVKKKDTSREASPFQPRVLSGSSGPSLPIHYRHCVFTLHGNQYNPAELDYTDLQVAFSQSPHSFNAITLLHFADCIPRFRWCCHHLKEPNF